MEIKHELIPYSHHLRCKWKGNKSLRWPEQCLAEHVGLSNNYNSKLNYVKRKHFLLKIVPSGGSGVVLPVAGRVVTGISGRVLLMDETSTLKSPSFPPLAASLSIFSIRFSATMALKLRVRSTITLPHLWEKNKVIRDSRYHLSLGFLPPVGPAKRKSANVKHVTLLTNLLLRKWWIFHYYGKLFHCEDVSWWH